MLNHGRARGAANARSRFCVDCGIAPPEKSQIKGYDPGAIIYNDGVQFVVCKECKRCASQRAHKLNPVMRQCAAYVNRL
jgi:hypothetical protein